MTLWILIVGWGLSLFLLAPRVFGWLSEQQRRTEQALVRRLESFHIFLEVTAIRWALVLLIGAALILGVGLFRSLMAAILIAGISLVATFAAVRYRTNKRIKMIRYQLPGVIELIATSLRSGQSIRSAFQQVSRQSERPIQQELAILERMQRIGIPLDTALSEWGKRMPIEEINLLAFSVGVSTASGGNLSDALDRLSAAWRQNLMLEEKVDALTAQGRLQAWVMAALPFLLALALTLLDPQSMQALWTTTAGHFVLGTVAILEIVGVFWIRRLIRVEV